MRYPAFGRHGLNTPLRFLCTRQNSKLAEHISRVPICPVVDGLSVPNVANRTSSGLDVSIRGRNAHERAAMGARCRPSRDDRVPTCDHLIDAEVKIGEGVHIHLHEASCSLQAPNGLGNGVRLDYVIRVKKLEITGWIVRVPGIPKLPTDLEILGFTHWRPPCLS